MPIVVLIYCLSIQAQGWALVGILFCPLPGVAQTSSTMIGSRTATVGGVKLHYLTAGHGPTIIWSMS